MNPQKQENKTTKISLRLPNELLRLILETYNPQGFFPLSQAIKAALLVSVAPEPQVSKEGVS